MFIVQFFWINCAIKLHIHHCIYQHLCFSHFFSLSDNTWPYMYHWVYQHLCFSYFLSLSNHTWPICWIGSETSPCWRHIIRLFLQFRYSRFVDVLLFASWFCHKSKIRILNDYRYIFIWDEDFRLEDFDGERWKFQNLVPFNDWKVSNF